MELSERQFVEQLAEEAGKKGLSAQCVQQLPHLVGWLVGEKEGMFFNRSNSLYNFCP